MAAPGRDERFLDLFLRDTGIAIDWDLDQALELFRGSGQGVAPGRATERAAEAGRDSERWTVLEPETAPDRAVGVGVAPVQAVEAVRHSEREVDSGQG